MGMLLPDFTPRGVFDYLGFAAGLMIGTFLLTPFFVSAQNEFRKNGGV